MPDKKYDVLVYGATGFTGKFVTVEIAHHPPSLTLPVSSPTRKNAEPSSPKKKPFTWAVAGRNEAKLKECLSDIPWHKAAASKPDVIVADVKDEKALGALFRQCRVVIDCVGPFRYFGEQVVKACIENQAHYVDINGETEFVEKMHVKYHDQAQLKGVSIVSCCGFDCVPAELGTVFIKKEFDKRGYTPATVEMFLSLLSGPKGLVINYATFESAVQSVAHVSELRALRRQHPKTPLPKIGGTCLRIYKKPTYDSRMGKWVVPFPGADASVVKLGQSISFTSRPKSIAGRPVQFAAYVTTQNIFYLLGMVIFGTVMTTLSSYSWGRSLLLRYPGLFSFGYFSKKGPSKEQIEGAHFSSTFIGKGYATPVDPFSTTTVLTNVEIKTRVTGPEFGYVTTPICVVQCAYALLSDTNKMIPTGVLTPASAFADTDLIDKLQGRGIHFTVVSESTRN